MISFEDFKKLAEHQQLEVAEKLKEEDKVIMNDPDADVSVDWWRERVKLHQQIGQYFKEHADEIQAYMQLKKARLN